MDETATPSLLDRATGFLGDLAESVIQYQNAQTARDIAVHNSSGGSTVAPSGALVNNSTQQSSATTAQSPKIPVAVWAVAGVGLALVVVALLLRR
jgi:hypothetical protein